MFLGAAPSLVAQWALYIFLSVFPLVYTEIKGTNKAKKGGKDK